MHETRPVTRLELAALYLFGICLGLLVVAALIGSLALGFAAAALSLVAAGVSAAASRWSS